MTATLSRKTLTAQVRVKDAEQGIVELVFSTFNKIDRDGDVTLKGAFKGNPPVVLSAYGHKSWDGLLPYGTGTIHETDTEAVAEVKFALDAPHAQSAFVIVKALSEAGLQEWSYSLEDVESERGQFEGKSVRFLKRVFIKEISPVLRGAGTDTRTLSVKGDRKQLNSDIVGQLRDAGTERWGGTSTYVYPQDFDVDEGYAVFCIYSDDEADRYVQVDISRDDDTVTLGDVETDVERVTAYAPKGASFSEHATAVMAAVDALTARASEVVALRAKKGKTISVASSELLKQLDAALMSLTATADDALASLRDVVDTPVPDQKFSDALLDIELGMIARRQGVTTCP